MRHTVNFTLLCAFATLLTTGAMAFFWPFSVATARLHVFSGIAVTALTVTHLAARVSYFQKALQFQIRGFSRGKLAAVLSLSLGATWLALWGWAPMSWVMNQSYEAIHRRQIFRASPLIGFGNTSPTNKVIVRKTKNSNGPELSVLLSFRETLPEFPSIAVWAESTNGTMIETLFLEDHLAYSEQVRWHGDTLGRNEILPIWRHKYTMVAGVEPDGSVDAVSGATGTHSFALDKYLIRENGNRFVLCVEINAASDPNADWTDPTKGQPSLLYTALVDVDRESPHALLELTGHGGRADDDGNVQYDLDTITTAREMADLFLVKLDR